MRPIGVCVLLTPELHGQLMQPAVMALLESFAQHRHVPVTPALGPEGVQQALSGVDAVLCGWRSPFLGCDVLSGAPSVRFIGYAAGSARAIVDEAVLRSGVVVCNASSVIAPYVAEMALALILALLRNLPENQREMKERRSWKAPAAIETRSLFGLTVGLVGFGGAARALVRLLRPFRVKVLVHDPFLSAEETRRRGVRQVSIEELLSSCDVVSLHAPDLPETRCMLGAERLGMLRDGAILVNTARGRLVDEEALAAELRSGRIKAGIDVYSTEPLPAASPLRDLGDNVVLASHIAGPAFTRRWEMALAVVRDMKAYFSGRPVRHRVPPDAFMRLA